MSDLMANPQQGDPKITHKELSLSPLESYQNKLCFVCKDSKWCKPNALRMLICVLSAVFDTLRRTNQLSAYREEES